MHQCFRCCWAVLARSRGFLFFWLGRSPLQWVGCGVGKGLREDQLGQLTWTDQRDLSYHVTSCSGIKPGVEEEGWVFGYQGGYCLEAGWALDCLGRWQVISFALFVCLFVYTHPLPRLLNCLCIDPELFLRLPFLFSTLCCAGEGEWASSCVSAQLLARVNPPQLFYVTDL